MSGTLQPYDPRPTVESVALTAPAPQGAAVTVSGDRGWEPPPAVRGGGIKRYVAALRRYAWLIVVFTVVGAGGGYFASTQIEPEYEVRAAVLLSRATKGPFQSEEFLATSGFRDLLRSFQVGDPVVNDLRLFLTPARPADSTVFRTFLVDQVRLRPGEYVLKTTGGRYTLALQRGIEIETGALGDSIGRTVGFLWQPPAATFAGRSSVGFTVVTPREASNGIIKKLLIPDADDAFIKMSLTGTDPQRTAATLNAWVKQFEKVATALKKSKVTQAVRILEGQREYAAQQVAEAEAALQRFRVETITEPSERSAIAPGLDMTTSPVLDLYFRDKVQAEMYRRDREAIEAVAKGASNGSGVDREAVLSIPTVANDPAAADLRTLLQEQVDREAAIRRLRETFQDEYPALREATAALAALRSTTVPRALGAYAAQLKQREDKLGAEITARSADLRAIPVRTIEEQRLKRQLEVANQTYMTLNLRAVEATMQDASTVPDVQLLDPAVAPLKPTNNTAPVIVAGSTAGAIAVAVLLAVLLDHLDRRFRYPEQVTEELGLSILGVMPVIAADGRNGADQAAQVVEAFRTVRMNVRYGALPNRPLTVTVTSPGHNDGKSLIASNLALSFAEAGARTLLIDGDIRHGELAETFGVPAEPGLVDYLDGRALLGEVLLPAGAHPNLTVMPAGARRRRAPELLATPRLPQLIAQMGRDFEVVIVDSPPLGAALDAFALGTATANMVLVMRPATTDRKMAAAKLAQLDTLPVRVVGAVVNGITPAAGAYEYYMYYRDDATEDEEAEREEVVGAVAATSSARAGAAPVRVDSPSGEDSWR
ncbi:MAG: polysaccharide biosynthesis tyrosine autokinase [Gemmatimonadetes bacterium]|nr:polysaccharide biosynthesis tyrosine autokinase [Gemmatimonadota bacterium]